MNKSLDYRVALLELLLNGTAFANVFDNAASSPITDIILSLHTADPGTSSDQTTNETTYGGYLRIAVARTSGGWTVDAATGIARPVSMISFAAPTSGAGTAITHVGIGRDASGAGFLFASGAINPIIVLVAGTPPQLTTASTITDL